MARIKRFFLTLLTAVAAFGASDTTLPPHRDGVLLMKFRVEVPVSLQTAILASLGATVIKQLGVGVSLISVGNGRVADALQAVLARSEVLFVEPDFQTLPLDDVAGPDPPPPTGALPNDTYIGSQWAVQNTGQTINGVAGTAGADERSLLAWSVTTGLNSIVIAVLDTGVQYSHPDLLTNIWSNPGGVGGCAAGTHGYNVLTSVCDPMDDDTSYNGHGSHVGGILGAVGNNGAGIAGVNWTASVMGVKWVSSAGTGFTSDLISAMDWVIQAKRVGINVRVVNDSQTFVGTAFSQALSDEIDLLTTDDILFVTAAGNTAQNNDVTPRYPCSYHRPGMICVGATDQNDNLWSSSNFGPVSVQLAAPGVNIYSTLRLSNFGYISGGSMAAAQVSGAAALILSLGYLNVANLISAILTHVDPLASLAGLVRTGGRLNICKAVPGCSTAVVAAPANSAAPLVTGVVQQGSLLGASTGFWTGAPDSYAYQWYRCNSGGTNCSAISGATLESYPVMASADKGATLAASVTASNSAGSAFARSIASAIVTAATSPFGLNSTITDGQTISGALLWQINPTQSINFAQFYIDGTLSQTVSSSPYEYNQSTTGKLDTATLTNGSYVLGIRALSAADNRTWGFFGGTVIVQNPPQNTALPVISGTPIQGQTLTTSNGSWTNNPTSFLYQWDRCNAGGSACLPISGETAVSYTTVAADLNSTLRALVIATNGIGSNTATSLATQVISGAVSITTASLPNGIQNTKYSATLSATGGVTPYTWSVTTGALPTGLSLAGATGAISGTPAGTGTSNFTVQVKDNNMQIASKALSITVSVATGAAYVQSSQNSPAGVAGNTGTVSLTGTAAGHLLVASINNGDDVVSNVRDTQNNTFAKAVSLRVGNQDIEVWYAMNIAGGNDAITVTGGSNTGYVWAAVTEYSGIVTASALDTTAGASGLGKSANSSNTATTSQANELVFGVVDWYTCMPNTLPLAGSGFTGRQSATCLANSDETIAEDKVVASTGAYNVTALGANASDSTWIALAATFKAAGSVAPSITTASLPNGTRGVAYNTTLAATGGTTPYIWSITVGTLPTGLSLAPATGVISGIPTEAGASNFTVQVMDSNTQTATRALSVLVNPTAPPVITTASLPNGALNTAYSATLTATGGATPYSWNVTTGTLPTGLSLDVATGVIFGTPTAIGTSNFTVQLTDANAQIASKALSITISGASGPSYVQSAQNNPAGTAGGTTNLSLTGTVAGHLLVLTVSNGDDIVSTVHDTQNNGFVKALSLRAGNQDLELWYAMNIAGGNDAITITGGANTGYIWAAVAEYSGIAATGALDKTAGATGTGQAASSGNTGTTTQSNELIAGVVDWFACAPNGIPVVGTGFTGRQSASCMANSDETIAEDRIVSSAGAYSVMATGANPSDSTWIGLAATFKAATPGAPSITTTTLPNGTQNNTYSTTLGATGGVTPYRWSVTAGTLPAGLSLSAGTGIISGTPTVTGTNNFTVQVTDANSQTASMALSIIINAPTPPTITTTSLPNGIRNTAYSATLMASGGVTPYTWSVTVGILPVGLALTPSSGVISGTPMVTGPSNFTVQVTDRNSQIATKALSIVIGATGTAAYVQSTQNSPSGTAGSTATVSLAGTAAGHLLVVGINNGDDTVASVHDSQNNIFAKATSLRVGNQDIEFWYAMNVVGGNDTITVTGGPKTGYIWLSAAEYSGVATVGALDRTASASGTGQSATSGNTAATTQANEVLVGIVDWYTCTAGAMPTAGPGLMGRQSAGCLANSDETVTEDNVVAATGSYSATAMGANPSDSTWIALVATFKASNGQ